MEAQPHFEDSPYIFTFNGRRPISFGRCKRDFIEKCGVSDWRIHNLRRTSRTLLSRAGVNADIAERCLGHALGGVRGIYDRHGFGNEMELAFEALSAEIETIINPPAGQVVRLRAPK